jgi:hypothetical protein
MMADVNGDRSADAVGFGDGGVLVATSQAMSHRIYLPITLSQ